MEPWVLITLAAAAVQTLRFMLQKGQRATGLSTGGATYARFVFAVPLAGAALGSLGWFTAFALQNAAYARSLGQVELIFSILASVVVFRERLRLWELASMAGLAASVVLIIWRISADRPTPLPVPRLGL